MPTTLTETIDDQQNQINALRNQVEELMESKTELMLEHLPLLAETIEGQQREINHLQEQVGELMRLKAESDKALRLWASEIQDPRLKETVMNFLVGDIRCLEEIDLDPPSFPGGVDPARNLASIAEEASTDDGDDSLVETQSLQRTKTCGGKRSRCEVCATI
jgi:hypothetical protein